MEKSTISMAISNSYGSLPEGTMVQPDIVDYDWTDHGDMGI